MSGSNFNHTVITSDGAALIRRSREENKKIVFVKAVSSQKFESLRGDLVHKPISWFESIEGSISAVQAVDGVFKMACQFSQAPSTVTLKSIGILAKLANETDAQAVLFSAASDDNSQLIVDESNAVVAFVQDLPASINAHDTDSYGTIPQGGSGGGGGDLSSYVTKSELASDLEGYVASGEYDSTTHNIYLKNADSEVLSTIDCSDFIVDGMIESVEIVNGNLVISFNTDSGKEDITIPISDIFDASNYYTKQECDETFLTSSDLSGYALSSEIPTATSDLNNDSGFITSSDLSTYALKSEIPTDTSDLNNDSGFITSSALSDYALKSEVPTDTSDLNNDSGFITSSALSGYALSSEIPTDNSELTNGAGYITSSSISNMATTDSAQTFTAGKSYLVNDVSLPFASQPLKLELINNGDDALFTKGDGTTVTIALSGGGSGNYVTTDTAQTITAAKTFTIPANAQNPIVTIDSTGVHSDLFDGKFIVSNTAYAFGVAGSKGVDTSIGSGATDNNLPTSLAVYTYISNQGFALSSEIPTDVSELNNDAGYITNSDLPTVNNATLTIQKNGTTVNTFTANASSDVTANITVPTAVSDLTNDSGFITTADLSGYVLASSLGDAAYKGVDTSISSSSTNNNVPTSLAVYSYIDAQGFLTQHQSLAGCVASGEYDSANHNIYLKNSSGTVLSTIDATAFIKDGMVDTVAISNGNLVITFNTDAGKQPISIPLSSIFDPTNYYTKTQIDSGFVTTNTAQNLTGTKTWANSSTASTITTTNNLIITGGATPSAVVEQVAHDSEYDEDTAVKRVTVDKGLFKLEDNSYTYAEYTPEVEEGEEEPEPEIYISDSSEYTTLLSKNSISLSHQVDSTTYEDDSPVTITNRDNFTVSLNASSSVLAFSYQEGDSESYSASFGFNGLDISYDNTNTSSGYSVTISDDGFEIVDAYDSNKFSVLSLSNGLQIKGGSSNSTLRQIDALGLKMGGTRIMWSTVPCRFMANDGGFYISTFGTSMQDEFLPKHWITQIHVKDVSGTLSCATQANSNTVHIWSPYTSLVSLQKGIADNRVNLIFDANGKLSSVRLTTTSSCGMVCNFKLMIPNSGTYSVVDGIIYADVSSTADYTFSTPITLSDGDLLISDVTFTPTYFTSVPND